MGSPEPPSSSADRSRPPPLAPVEPRESARGRALRIRFILVVVAVCGAVWLSALFDALRDRRLTLAEAERQNDNVAGALAEQAARALQATDLILKQAVLLDPDSPGAPADRAGLAELLRRYMSGVPQVRNLFLFDPSRALRVSSAPATNANPDLSDRTYYIVQRDSPDLGLFVSEPFIRPRDRRPDIRPQSPAGGRHLVPWHRRRCGGRGLHPPLLPGAGHGGGQRNRAAARGWQGAGQPRAH